MSRAPGVGGTVDIRSASLLQETVLVNNPCAPGANRLKKRSYHDDLRSRKGAFDNAKSWITIIAAMLIIATVIGIYHASFLMVPIVQQKYDLGIVFIILTYVIGFMIIIKLSTIACYCIDWIGHRMTITFAMVIYFIGVIIEVFSEDLPWSAWFSGIFLMAVGAAFAKTACMSIASDVFRNQLASALTVVSVGVPLGIIIFYIMIWFCLLFLHIGYRWTKLFLALVVLLMIGVAQIFAKPRRCNTEVHSLDSDWSSKEKRIKDCVANEAGIVKKTPLIKSDDDCMEEVDTTDKDKSCLCVCVCDVSLWSDWSFLLWAVVSSMGLISYYVPYFFLMAYSYEIGGYTSIWLIVWMCVGSIISRFIMLSGVDFTFFTNRLLFQIVLVAIGILYIVVLWAITYGWILLWGVFIGIMEGALTSLIPRLTLLTIPRKWVVSSWSCILWFHAVGIMIGPMLVASVWFWAGVYDVSFITIAVFKFIAAIMATLLPNEEGEMFEDQVQTTKIVPVVKDTNMNQPFRMTNLTYTSRFANSYGGRSLGSLNSGSRPPCFTADRNYKCCCPICRKYGCIPGCTPCTPGGLSGGNCDGETAVSGDKSEECPPESGSGGEGPPSSPVDKQGSQPDKTGESPRSPVNNSGKEPQKTGDPPPSPANKSGNQPEKTGIRPTSPANKSGNQPEKTGIRPTSPANKPGSSPQKTVTVFPGEENDHHHHHQIPSSNSKDKVKPGSHGTVKRVSLQIRQVVKSDSDKSVNSQDGSTTQRKGS